MATIPGSVRVGGFIAPSDSTDTYGVTHEDYNIGGFRSTADMAGRFAITMDRRKEGMLVHQVIDDTYWTLKDGITDAHWEPEDFNSGWTLKKTIVITGHIAVNEAINVNVSDAKHDVSGDMIALGVDALSFNNNKKIFIERCGIVQDKGIDVIWVSNVSFTFTIDFDAGDKIIILA